MKIEPQQIRAARQLIGWLPMKLAMEANIEASTLLKIEMGRTTRRKRTLSRLQGALEAAGVEFIAENGGGVGVRLRSTIGYADESGHASG